MLTSPFKINNFEGPLELLVHLVQQGEINALEIVLEGLTGQLSNKSKEANLDENAEALFLTASLIFLKSQQLLPRSAALPAADQEALKGEIITKMIELYAIKEKASNLEEKLQSPCYRRGRYYEERSRRLTLPAPEDFARLFEKIVTKSSQPKAFRTIESIWQLKAQASWLKKELSSKETLSFAEVFAINEPVMKRIVTFLAALELLRCHEIHIEKRDEGYFFRTHSSAVCRERSSDES